jgi:hypothetical protein
VSAVAPSVPDGFEALAREALAEVTTPESVGALIASEQPADDVTDLAFASTLPGYIGWRWTVSMAQLPDAPPSVLEVELLPNEGALLAPPWVPWAERLAEYRRTHPDEVDVVDADEDLDEDLDEDVLDDLDEDELDPDEDVLDDEADDELDGVDFEATVDLDEVEEVLDDEGDDLLDEDEDEDEDGIDEDGIDEDGIDEDGTGEDGTGEDGTGEDGTGEDGRERSEDRADREGASPEA